MTYVEETKEEERIEFVEFQMITQEVDRYPGLLAVLEPEWILPKKFCGVEIDPEV